MNIPLWIIAATLLIAFSFCLRGFRTMTLEQWSVGGRGFGTVFVFLLLAGEIYTTFTFLGGSGWAYGRGAPAFYIITYGTIAYIMSYWLLPAIWKRGTNWQVLSQPEFFARAYKSPALGKLVAVVSIAALIPYLVLQLKGLGIIVSEVSEGVAAMTFSKSTLATLLPGFPHAITDLNIGVVAMVLNVVVMFLVHALAPDGQVGARTSALPQ